MKYLGIDFGTKRIGLALSDEAGSLAFPHGVLENQKGTLGEIQVICQTNQISTVIMGESRDFKNKENKVMGDTREFVEQLKAAGLDVIYEPEILSTVQAQQIQGENKEIDASAAAIILQSFLDRQKFAKAEASPKDESNQQYTNGRTNHLAGEYEDQKSENN